MKVQLLITSHLAKPGSVGAILGQRGLNSNEFCKRFNHESSNVLRLKDGFNYPVKLMVDEDGDYELIIVHPQMSSLLSKSARFFSLQAVYELASLCLVFEAKKTVTVTVTVTVGELKARCQQIIGTARSVGMKL